MVTVRRRETSYCLVKSARDDFRGMFEGAGMSLYNSVREKKQMASFQWHVLNSLGPCPLSQDQPGRQPAELTSEEASSSAGPWRSPAGQQPR